MIKLRSDDGSINPQHLDQLISDNSGLTLKLKILTVHEQKLTEELESLTADFAILNKTNQGNQNCIKELDSYIVELERQKVVLKQLLNNEKDINAEFTEKIQNLESQKKAADEKRIRDLESQKKRH